MAKQLVHEVDLYDRDLYTWALRQAELVRAHRLGELDLENIAEELRSLGSEQGYPSNLVTGCSLCTCSSGPQRRSRSGRATMLRERINAAQPLERNPGLKSRQTELFVEAYRAARKEAAAETGLPIATFPEAPPFTLDQATDEDFWPEPDTRS